MKEFDLTGKTALVTGGNGGIGKGIARGLARAGANVFIAGRDAAKNEAVARELGAICACESRVCDVTDATALDGLFEAIRARFGGLHVVVNNAGISALAAPEDIGDEEWDQVLNVNLKAALKVSQRAFVLLRDAGGGKIINIASEYALFGSGFVPSYAASKGGLVQLTRSLAIAWARHNIQVNALIPGWISTDMTAAVEGAPALRDTIVQRTPAGRFGQPDELGGAAVFLASKASDFVTGISLPVDGGYAIA